MKLVDVINHNYEKALNKAIARIEGMNASYESNYVTLLTLSENENKEQVEDILSILEMQVKLFKGGEPLSSLVTLVAFIEDALKRTDTYLEVTTALVTAFATFSSLMIACAVLNKGLVKAFNLSEKRVVLYTTLVFFIVPLLIIVIRALTGKKEESSLDKVWAESKREGMYPVGILLSKVWDLFKVNIVWDTLLLIVNFIVLVFLCSHAARIPFRVGLQKFWELAKESKKMLIYFGVQKLAMFVGSFAMTSMISKLSSIKLSAPSTEDQAEKEFNRATTKYGV
jgi:hypothetical protein